MAKPRLTLSEEIALLHSLTAEELTIAACLCARYDYERIGDKLRALRDALYPKEADENV